MSWGLSPVSSSTIPDWGEIVSHKHQNSKEIDAHTREVIRSCLNVVEQKGDTYVAIHKDDDVECVVLVSLIRSLNVLSIIVADKLLMREEHSKRMYAITNELNLDSLTGWHCVYVEDNGTLYLYRQMLWCSMQLCYEQLLALLKSCIAEYTRGKQKLFEEPTPPAGLAT